MRGKETLLSCCDWRLTMDEDTTYWRVKLNQPDLRAKSKYQLLWPLIISRILSATPQGS
jgi:hypothetical protein